MIRSVPVSVSIFIFFIASPIFPESGKVVGFRNQAEEAKIRVLSVMQSQSAQNESGKSEMLQQTVPTAQDTVWNLHSFARLDEVVVKHLNLDITVDFSKKRLDGRAALEIENKTGARKLYLDTDELIIQNVTLGKEQAKTQFQLGEKVEHLGEPLIIDIQPDTRLVTVQYATSPDAKALQWLDPEQTAGKKHPFLFTQMS